MDILHTLLGADVKAGFLIILNLVVIESLLSVDNAAVLATMVMDLPERQRGKALKYGIVGAYIFRGLCLLVASWLVKVWFLKPLGGLYLIYLAYSYFSKKIKAEQGDDEHVDKGSSKLYAATVGRLGNFWATVALVEVMDLAFSIDNVFAAVAFTDNLFLIYTGVFIGILAMRFVAQAFVKLMEKFTFLETVAFVVIGLLGIKLGLSLYTHFMSESGLAKALEGEQADMYVSLFTVGIFAVPVLTSVLFGYPRKGK